MNPKRRPSLYVEINQLRNFIEHYKDVPESQQEMKLKRKLIKAKKILRGIDPELDFTSRHRYKQWKARIKKQHDGDYRQQARQANQRLVHINSIGTLQTMQNVEDTFAN